MLHVVYGDRGRENLIILGFGIRCDRMAILKRASYFHNQTNLNSTPSHTSNGVVQLNYQADSLIYLKGYT